MSREMGIFPYLDTAVAPNADTDGTLASIPTGRDVTITGPQHRAMRPKNRGAIVDGGIGNTNFIDCNTTSHEIFTGSF